MDHIGAIAQNLHLDVAGAFDDLFHIQATIAKGGLRLGTGLGQKAVKVFDVLGNANATSAATCCGFDHHRKADFQRQGTGLIGVVNPPI